MIGRRLRALALATWPAPAALLLVSAASLLLRHGDPAPGTRIASGLATAAGLLIAVHLLRGPARLLACVYLEPATPRRPGRTPAVLAGLALLAAVGLVFVNLHVLVRQYPAIHAGAALAAFWLAVMGFRRLRPRHGLTAVALVWMLAGAAAALSPEPPPGTRSFAPAGRLHDAVVGLLARHAPPAPRGDPSLVAGEWGRVVSGRRAELLAAGGGRTPRTFVLVTIDALRARSVGFLGHDRATTPFLDGLAAESLVFERAYAQATHTMSSLLSTFTGRYPAALGYTRRAYGLAPPSSEPTLAETFAAGGYRTVGIPAFRPALIRGDFGALGRGFHDYARPRSAAAVPRAARVAERALEVLRHRRGEPLFLWVHFMNVHGPYDGIDRVFGDGLEEVYDAAILEVDHALRHLISTARAEGRLDDAVVAVHADHGEELEEHGGRYHGTTLFEEAVHVPLLLWMAGAPARRVARPVELVDVMPTLLDLAGLPPLAGLHGDSLLGDWLGDASGGFALAQVHGGGGWTADLVALVERRYKIIARAGGDAAAYFDLRTNPGERPGRDGECPAPVRARLRARLAAAAAVAARIPEATEAAAPGRPRRPPPGAAAAAGTRAERRQALRRRLEATPDAKAARTLLTRLNEVIEPDDLEWLDSWSRGRSPELEDAVLVTRLHAGAPGAERAVLERLPLAPRDELFHGAASRLARRPGSPVRHALIAAVAASPPRPRLAAIALGHLFDAGDPAAPSLLLAARRRPGALPASFDRLVLDALAARGPDLARESIPVLACIARDGRPPWRARAFDLLATVDDPVELLDRQERDGARPAPDWRRLHLTPGRGSLRIASAGPDTPLLSLRVATDAPPAVRGRFLFPLTVRSGGRHAAGTLFLEPDGSGVIGSFLATAAGDEITVAAPDGAVLLRTRL